LIDLTDHNPVSEKPKSRNPEKPKSKSPEKPSPRVLVKTRSKNQCPKNQ
jgi:hypothetical protein